MNVDWTPGRVLRSARCRRTLAAAALPGVAPAGAGRVSLWADEPHTSYVKRKTSPAGGVFVCPAASPGARKERYVSSIGRRCSRFHPRVDRRPAPFSRVDRRRLGRPLLAPGRFHAGLHDRTRRDGMTRSTSIASGRPTSPRRKVPRSTFPCSAMQIVKFRRCTVSSTRTLTVRRPYGQCSSSIQTRRSG